MNPVISHFSFKKPSLYWEALPGQYGRQDLGITPGGAMDAFSWRLGNCLLGNDEHSLALEIIFSAGIVVEKPLRLVFTGVEYESIVIERKDQSFVITSGQAFQAEPGDQISFGKALEGFRTYLCYREGREPPSGRPRPVNTSALNASWRDPEGKIRVLPGPEYALLADPQSFVGAVWQTTNQMDRMGIRLSGPVDDLHCRITGMISQPVADGTIQLTPTGPIILLRHRQTTGGYPRIFNVISADVDLLGQYAPFRDITFRQITRQESSRIYTAKEACLPTQ